MHFRPNLFMFVQISCDDAAAAVVSGTFSDAKRFFFSSILLHSYTFLNLKLLNQHVYTNNTFNVKPSAVFQLIVLVLCDLGSLSSHLSALISGTAGSCFQPDVQTKFETMEDQSCHSKK